MHDSTDIFSLFAVRKLFIDLIPAHGQQLYGSCYVSTHCTGITSVGRNEVFFDFTFDDDSLNHNILLHNNYNSNNIHFVRHYAPN